MPAPTGSKCQKEMPAANDAAIVNEVAAARLWPGALGKPICVFCTPENPLTWKRVVAVVSDVRHAALDSAQAQFLVVRTSPPPGEMAKAIRRAIAVVDPNQPVFLNVSMETLVADSMADRRLILTLLAATGGRPLLTAVAGGWSSPVRRAHGLLAPARRATRVDPMAALREE